MTDQTKAPDQPKKLFDLSVPQVVAGALAAAIVTALGARLGLAGTIAGAALFSIIATVASAMFRKGLEHSHAQVRDWFGGAKAATGQTVDSPTAHATSASDDTAWTTVPDSASEPEIPASEPEIPASEPEIPASDEATPPSEERATTETSVPRTRPAIIGAVAGSLATFVLALAFIVGFEVLTGQTLDGRTGTSLGNVAGQAATPAPTVTVTPVVTLAPTVTITPTVTASTTPVPVVTVTTTATATATATTTATTTATPTAAAPSSTSPAAATTPQPGV